MFNLLRSCWRLRHDRRLRLRLSCESCHGTGGEIIAQMKYRNEEFKDCDSCETYFKSVEGIVLSGYRRDNRGAFRVTMGTKRATLPAVVPSPELRSAFLSPIG